MKKTTLIRILLLIAYCVPFAFLSVNGDATSGTMLFYGVMIAGFALLCWGAIKTSNTAILYIGNVISFASSYGVVNRYFSCGYYHSDDYHIDLRPQERGKMMY